MVVNRTLGICLFHRRILVTNDGIQDVGGESVDTAICVFQQLPGCFFNITALVH